MVFSSPVYGGTDHFIRHFLNGLDVMAIEFTPKENKEAILQRIESSGRQHRLKLVYVETPANPTNTLIDLTMCREIANAYQTSENPEVIVAVDNTYMGPLWQHPLDHGADLSIYSATKYIGGHSDVIAGAICGSSALIKRLKVLRTFLGNMCGPWTGWLLLRSLETLVVRMERQTYNAQRVAAFLQDHPKVERVYYPGLLSEKDGVQYDIYKNQCLSPGAMISFDISGGEAEAFAFLNQLKLVKMAVSLGSTESLAEHPASMTHAGVDQMHRHEMGITDQMVRLSVGVEHADDLIWDLTQALG